MAAKPARMVVRRPCCQTAARRDGGRDSQQRVETEARLIRAIDEDIIYLARVLRVEVGELYPESIRLALDLYEAIRRSKALRYGILFFTALISCSQMGAGALDLVTRMGA
jgi:hypothetical protein